VAPVGTLSEPIHWTSAAITSRGDSGWHLCVHLVYLHPCQTQNQSHQAHPPPLKSDCTTEGVEQVSHSSPSPPSEESPADNNNNSNKPTTDACATQGSSSSSPNQHVRSSPHHHHSHAQSTRAKSKCSAPPSLHPQHTPHSCIAMATSSPSSASPAARTVMSMSPRNRGNSNARLASWRRKSSPPHGSNVWYDRCT
jgi:hypothetical protein